MVHYYLLDRVLDKIKKWEIENFNESKILIDTDDKLQNNIIIKNVVTLMTCAIKDDGKFYPRIFLEKAFFFK